MTDPTDRSGFSSPSGSTEGDREGFGEAPPEEAATPQPGDPRLDAALSQLRAIAGALAMGVVAYAVLGWYLTSGVAGRPYEAPGLPGILVAVLAAFAVFDLLVAPVIERSLAPRVGPGAGADELAQALARYRRAKILGFAFREAAAVLGLIISLFTGEAAWCYALGAATLVAMAVAWPSREALERAARGSVRPK